MIRRFCRFQTKAGLEHWGVLRGDLLEEIMPDPFGPFAPTGLVWKLKDVRLLAPSRPSKIVCVGINYTDHAKDFGMAVPADPLIFLKPPSAIINPGDAIRLPGAASKHVEHEGELAVVIGRKAHNLSPAAAMKHVLGFTIMNDVTARDLQRKDNQWSRAKGFDTFAPLGPWIAAGVDPADLKIETLVNGKPRQNARTSQMVFKVPRLVSHISCIMTLEPGDIVSTGTPVGVGPLRRGDRVEVRIEKIGSLVNVVR